MLASSVDEFRLFSAALIWALALVGGLGPLLLRRFSNTSNSNTSNKAAELTSVLNMFAGGIFLAGACLHLLPDAQSNQALATWLCESGDGCFQWANFFFGLGFLLVLLVDVFAHALQHKLSHGRQQQELTPLLTSDQRPVEQLRVRDHHRRHESCSSQETDASSSPHNHDVETGTNGDTQSFELNTPALYGSTSAITKQQQQTLEYVAPAPQSLLASAVVFLALSFHSVMEGLGLGASGHAAWDILVVVLAHKSLAAFALSQQQLLAQHQHPNHNHVLASIGLFALMTPAGILLGWLLVESDPTTTATTTESLTSGVCAALAGGTFLFVAAMEVLPRELRDQHAALVPKCGALLAGFGAMGVLSIWT